MNFRLLLKPRFFLRKTREEKKVLQVQETLKNEMSELKNIATGFIKQISMLRFQKETTIQEENTLKEELPIQEETIKEVKQAIKQPEPIQKIVQKQVQTPIQRQIPKYVPPPITITKPIKQISFPYQFGGIKSYSPNDNSLMRDSLSCINDFQNLYGCLMDAAERKDKDWLEANVHKDLVQPFLQTKNLYQINKNQPMNILFNRFDFFKGTNIDKYFECKPKPFFRHNFDNKFYHVDLFNQSLKAIGPIKPNENVYAASFKVVFLSSRKLSLRKDGMHQKQIQEAHEITFLKQIPDQVHSKIYQKIFQPEQVSAFHMTIVDVGETWKIINFDNYLTDPMK